MGHPGIEHVGPQGVSFRFGARHRWRIRVAVIAWWQAGELDRQLAAGANPRASPVLALRAKKITAPRSRRRIAAGLAGTLRRVQDTRIGLTAAVRPQVREVVAARAVFAALDRRLCAPEPVTARGLAMLQALLTDCASPLYQPREPGVLGSRLRAAAAALEPSSRDDSAAPPADRVRARSR
jgi:hypothetical protein